MDGDSIVILVVVALILVIVVSSRSTPSAPAEVGLVVQAVRVPQARARTTPSRSAARPATRPTLLMPGLRVQALADLRRQEVPVGAGAGGRDRRGHRAGRRRRCRSAPRARSTSPSSATSPTCATFVDDGGQKGVQRPVLPPGTLVPIHPVGVPRAHRADASTALPVSPELAAPVRTADARARVVRPLARSAARRRDRARRRRSTWSGVVTTLEGEPLPSGDIASRLGGFDDVAAMEARRGGRPSPTPSSSTLLLGSKNDAAQQLPGLPGVPRRRRPDRAAARPAALRRLPAEPVPRRASTSCRCWW